MLETLKIRNIAVIDEAEIHFRGGLNVLSGETGAGKSMIIEAISLLLGSRASADLVRTGCDEAVVEGLFDISNLPQVSKRLESLGFTADGTELLIKRSVHRAGKHRIYVNGELATLNNLQEVTEGLVDLCSQHEHQSLVKPATQLELLDRYGGLTEQTGNFSEVFSQARALSQELQDLRELEAERTRRSDFLKFQIEELKAANLQPGEDQALHQEKQLLQSAEGRVQTAESVWQILESEDDEHSGVLASLRAAIPKLRGLSQLDERAVPLLEGLERALAEAEEVSLSLNRYLNSVDLNPERLLQVQERLSALAELRRKYGPTVESMIETLGTLEKELSSLDQVNDRISGLSNQLETVRAEVQKLGRKLSHSRKKISETLAASVTAELKDLNMSDAKFSVELESRENLEDWSATGADLIQFLVQTNRGEAARPLGKIASGGELSRLMLAIRRVIADRGGIGVYLFDEIDAGIGGQTAFQVGKKLKSVAAYNQVICITHLPQVASFADHHLSVRKAIAGKRTMTEVIELRSRDRKEEIARMLGGPVLTKKSLENAAELMELASK